MVPYVVFGWHELYTSVTTSQGNCCSLFMDQFEDRHAILARFAMLLARLRELMKQVCERCYRARNAIEMAVK